MRVYLKITSFVLLGIAIALICEQEPINSVYAYLLTLIAIFSFALSCSSKEE